MERFNNFINKQDYRLSCRTEIFEMALYTIATFFIPLMIGHPQIIVGVLVNASLITAALNVRGYKLLPIIIAPSLGALSRCILFGPFTIFLVYMIPFIWIGNSILVFLFKLLNMNNKVSYWPTLLIGAFTKALFLFGIAYLLVNLKILPPLFLTTMGVFQFYTAVLGGIIAFLLHFTKKRLSLG